ncbi:nicotinate phosphoribosyltransferase [Prevotella sp. kh1p2]|uniref:nicotinate phosphoribosyltransferase n=1 Tax=Prevotella sp. kh1p2 TaxID=1761883 RepID=UPI0008BB7798|nr:nicotinate phosphoribosyltransferase [Prevotella sp. kh1p2]SES90025.1 nicotinate phosphoribosyltransferase [Prevotella sp. kh1p2]SNU11609.1 nicotinate phosphoribosyltransferase [Prevotellaceae bacterium KH2P17]
MRQIINHFTDDDLYKFSMCCAVIDNFPRAQVKYTFVDRNDQVYPFGFADELNHQIRLLENVVITDEEVAFMRRRCYYIPDWFYKYLKGYRYNHEWVKAWQDDEGHLHVEFEGNWSDTILLEVKVLAIISELFYTMTGQDEKFDYEAYYRKTYAKGERLLAAGCVYSDFGTRRRASLEAEDTIVRAMSDCCRSRQWPGRFVGTSNVYLAMKYDLQPVGTMAHEFVCAIGGMFGPLMANHMAMNAWRNTFRGALGTYLYDSYGWDIFSLNFSEDFAHLFKGLRVDSGNNHEQLMKIAEKYRSFGIDPRSKQVIFSNALDTDRAIEIQRYAVDYCVPSFGIGTHFTNDFADITPMNIVIKLTAVKITETWPFYNDTCKLSEDKGKHTGKPEVIRRFMDEIHFTE